MANRLGMRGISASHSTQARTRLLQEFGTAAVLHDHFLHFVAKAHKLQPVAEPVTRADDRFQPRFLGGIRKGQLKAHRCSHWNGARNVSADSAAAEAVGPPKSGVVVP